MKKNFTEIEIPFGVKDSELYQFTYTIPDGYFAEIKDGMVIVQKKESDDERIRKELLKEIEFISPRDGETDGEGLILPSYHARIDRYKSYLEKQKEQKPKWSEENEKHLYNAIEAVKYTYDVSVGSSGAQCIEFLKSLRPQPHWKPSEEQIGILGKVFAGCQLKDSERDSMVDLFYHLKDMI